MARQQIDSTGRFPLGVRVSSRPYYATQFPNSGPFPVRGTVVGYPRWPRGIRVKIDNRVEARSMHVDFWEPVSEEAHGKPLRG